MSNGGKEDLVIVTRRKDGFVIQQVCLFSFRQFAEHLAEILTTSEVHSWNIYEGKQWRSGDFYHLPVSSWRRKE